MTFRKPEMTYTISEFVLIVNFGHFVPISFNLIYILHYNLEIQTF